MPSQHGATFDISDEENIINSVREWKSGCD